MSDSRYRPVVANVASLGIIYRASNPREIFIEIKDGGYPMKAFQWCLCPIGGNWLGDRARADKNPYDTFVREFGEEFSLEKPRASTFELQLLDTPHEAETYVTPVNSVPIEEQDRLMLHHIRSAVTTHTWPFADYLVSVPRAVLDKVDPENRRDSYASLFSYWEVGLDDERWNRLVVLQQKFGNLSNESITIVTSLDEILRMRPQTAFGHHAALQDFFLQAGYAEAVHYPLFEGIECMHMGQPLSTYEEYLERYDILKKPV